MKLSVSDGLVGNIVLSTRLLPMDIDGLSPSTLLIYDDCLCFCDELWPSLIAIFFVVFVLLKIKSFLEGICEVTSDIWMEWVGSKEIASFSKLFI